VSAQPKEQISLYRRNRPRTFADVVGQEAVVRTLRNAVERGKVHHAYLFVGSRGTGKTSMAKILAACLNCQNGPTTEPCGSCESCVSIAAATSLDVIEMDAASNNSVDDIRELRDSVAYAPVSGRQKVYILDEAHMLSQAAWNAFLKTLEEPPPNTVFVLATTEAGKVPATVVDRCHRFDFMRPTIEQLAGVVRRAAAAESIDIPPEAVATIARGATGSFRDALGTLEQLLTYSGTSIAMADVLAVLGVADTQLIEAVLDGVQAGDAPAVLRAVATCAEQGRDASALAGDLEARARELLVVQTLQEVPSELKLTAELDERLLEQSARIAPAAVVRLLELLGAALEAVRAGADPRTQLELALVKAAKPDLDPAVRALAARVERLEGRAGVDGPEVVVQPVQAEPEPAESEEAVRPEPAESEAVVQPGQPETEAVVQPEAPETEAVVEEAVVEPEVAVQPPDPAVADSVESLQALWPSVVDAILKVPNAMLAAAIAEARPVGIEGEELTVAFDSSIPFMKKKAEDPENRTLVAAALRELTGRRLRPSYELRELAATPGAAAAYSEEEWVARFIDELDAEELAPEPSEKG
jgi:DNA polymerase-3 subunit gamma/tau